MCAMLKVVLHEKHWKSLNRGLQLLRTAIACVARSSFVASKSVLFVRSTPYGILFSLVQFTA